MIILEQSLSLEAARWFDAPPRRLFEAWLHESRGEWLAPGAAYCVSSIVNPKIGGRFSLAMRMPGGDAMSVNGTYREIAPSSRMAMTWNPDRGKETIITLAFHPVSEGTQLVLRQAGFAAARDRDGSRDGWTGRNGCFDKLARFLGETFRTAAER